MSLNKEEPQRNLQQSEVDLDNLLTDFLDKEIGSPSEKGELAPDLDLKLKETLREIGMVNATAEAGPIGKDVFSVPPGATIPPILARGEEPLKEGRVKSQVLIPSQVPAFERPTLHPKADPTLDLGFAIQGAMRSEKLTIRSRRPMLAAVLAGLAAVLGIGSYLWLAPGDGDKRHEPASVAQSNTAPLDQAAVPTPSVAGPEAGHLTSPDSSARKTELRQPSTGSQKTEGSPSGTISSASRASLAPTSASKADAKGAAESGGFGTQTPGNPKAAAVPVSPAPPPVPKQLVPELPSPDSNAAIAIKDLSLPKPALDSASQPQIALPTAAIVEQAHATIVTPAVALSKIRLAYPEMARRARVKGTVDVDFSVDKYGKVVEATAKSGPVVLRKAAEDAIYLTRFKPATSNGVNVPAKGKITLVFNLENQ